MCFVEKEFIASETLHLFFNQVEQTLICINQDQNMFSYEVKSKKKGPKLVKHASKCLYLDEVIDIKFIKQFNEEGSQVDS